MEGKEEGSQEKKVPHKKVLTPDSKTRKKSVNSSSKGKVAALILYIVN